MILLAIMWYVRSLPIMCVLLLAILHVLTVVNVLGLTFVLLHVCVYLFVQCVGYM